MANYKGYKNDTLGKNETLRLLNDITPTESQGTLTLTADDNNNDYDLKEVYINFEKVDAWALVRVFFTDNTSQNLYFTTASVYGGVVYIKINDSGIVEGKNFTLSEEKYNYTVHPIFVNLVSNVSIKKIILTKLVANTNVKVYGR